MKKQDDFIEIVQRNVSKIHKDYPYPVGPGVQSNRKGINLTNFNFHIPETLVYKTTREMYISTLIIDKIISLFLNLKARIFFVIKIYKFEKKRNNHYLY